VARRATYHLRQQAQSSLITRGLPRSSLRLRSRGRLNRGYMDENIGAPLTEEEEQERLAEQARIRREKLAKLASEGRNPYEKVKYDVTADSAYIKNNFSSLEGKEVSIAGRLMSRRIMGKASFSHISDRDGLIQIYVKRDDVGEED